MLIVVVQKIVSHQLKGNHLYTEAKTVHKIGTPVVPIFEYIRPR